MLFNIIIILLLLHSVLGRHSTVLACGLFAFIGNSTTKFNWDKFNYLGAANDSRGGDSCGVVTTDFHKYGIGLESDYKDFVTKTEKGFSGKYKVILGHTRKASVGAIDLDHAQPYIFTTKSRIVKRMKKKDTTLAKYVEKDTKDRIVFAGIHNGTLNNYKELAEKYKINAFDKNDSGVLMEIIFKYGFDVLKEYKGTAAIITHNYATNVSYVFRGSSPMYYSNATSVEERPLYAYYESPHNTYFSSLKDSLKFIGGRHDTIDEVVPNVLYKIQNGKIVDKIKVDRSDVPQREYTTAKSTTTNRSAARDFTNAEDYYNDAWGYGETSENIKKNNKKYRQAAGKYINGKKIDESLITGKIHIMNETKPYLPTIDTNNIYFHKGRYFICGVLAQGVIHISAWGKKTLPTDHAARPYFFVDGVMIQDRAAYEKGLGIIQKHKGTDRELARELAPLSIYPVHSYSKSGERNYQFQDFYKPSVGYVTHKETKGMKVMSGRVHFNGEFQPVFSKRVYFIKNGDLQGIATETWGKTPTEEFGTLYNPKKVTSPIDTTVEKDKDRVIIMPSKDDDYPECPCYECRSQDSLKCNNCVELDEYLEIFNEADKIREQDKKQAKKDIENAGGTVKGSEDTQTQIELDQESDDAYNAAYDDATYMELYEKQIKTIVEDCSQGLQEAIEELYSMGPAEASADLEQIIMATRSSLIKFEEKHFD